jgi:ribose 1,5-bisphosphokinase
MSWVFVCGPSGAGKDSVMACARNLLAGHERIVFARRIVTRPVQIGSDHDPHTDAQFEQALREQAVCWHWQAHGFFYGIDTRYTQAVRDGQVVVVNASRAHVKGLAPSAGFSVVEISVDPTQLALRLNHRGRDSESSQALRLARNASFSSIRADCVVDNSQALTDAGRALADYLLLVSGRA